MGSKKMLYMNMVMQIMPNDKLIIDMLYSDNHVEVSLDAFLASEEYAKESIKDLEMVFDQNAAYSIHKRVTHSVALFVYGAGGSRTARPWCKAPRERASGTFEPQPGLKGA
jgi:hypothetical protein